MSLVLQGKFTTEAERVLTRAAEDFKLAKFWHAIWLVGTGEVANAKVQLRTYISDGEGPAVKTATAVLRQLESER
jgi:hypothetical protein